MPASPLRVRAMMNRMSRSRRPSLWETTTTTWGPFIQLGGGRFSSVSFEVRESHTHSERKNEMMSRKRKEERILLYIFRNDNRAQPWSGQMMDRPASSHSALARRNRLFSQPKWREKETSQKSKKEEQKR